MTTSPTVYHGGERHNQPNRHVPPLTFSLSHCTLQQLHHPSCDMFSSSPLPYEGTVISSPMAYDYPSQTPEFLEKNYRPNSAGHSAWTSAATLSRPFSDSKPAALVTSGSTPDRGSAVLTSVSTPSIGFENSTPASALSFPSPTLFCGELSSIQQSHSASDLSCCSTPVAPALPHPLLSSTSSDDCSYPWSLSINSLPTTQLNSSSSLLALSDPVPSDSSSRSWTPDQTESLNPPTGIPELHGTPYQQPPIGSQADTRPGSFSSDPGKTLTSTRTKHHAARFLPPERLIINPNDAFRFIQPSLSSQLSPFCEDAEYFTPSPTFSPNSINLRSHLPETASQLCSLTPLTASPVGPGVMNGTPSNFGIPSTWLQPSHFVHADRTRCHSEYDGNPNPRTFPSSRNFSPFTESVNQSPQVLNSKCQNRSSSPNHYPPHLIPAKNNNNENSLPDASRRVFIEPISNPNVQHVNKPHKKKKRDVRELEATCGVCGERIARLTLRGSPEELYVADGFELVHTCKRCQEGRPRGASLVGSSASPFAPFSGRSFVNSAKCQQLEFLYPEPIPQNTMTTFRKRNRRTDDLTAPTTCDCCARQLGVGGILPRNGRSAIQFVVEVVCVYCINNFRRCTDCGGGGGARLGVGKWRCKELFSDGRRTCVLSHQRQGASTEVATTVWKVTDLSQKPELDTLVGQVRELVKHSLYAALATPEMLESGLARITSFEDIKTMYTNGWKRIEPLIREDVEPSSGRRRYVGLRWTKPHPRKGPKRISTIPDKCSTAMTPAIGSDIVLQPGKELSGFVMSEWDMHHGTFFISVAMPWQSGDSLELTTELANKCFIKAKLDREKLIDDVVHQGTNRGDAILLYPPIRHLWTLLFFHRDARLVQFLEKKRKFIPLEQYLSQYPDARREFFPPERDCYVPTDEQQGWNVWVRRENGNTHTSDMKQPDSRC